MQIQTGINPNCSECAFVIYPRMLNIEQKEFFNKFIKDRHLSITKTPKENMSIETGDNNNPCYKDGLWDLRNAIQAISDYNKLNIMEDIHYSLIRDDSYYDLIEEGKI